MLKETEELLLSKYGIDKNILDLSKEVDQEIKAQFDRLKEIREYNCRDKYMMLSKIYHDLIAYLGKTGNEEQDKQDFRYHNDKYGLWGNSVDETIEEVKTILREELEG